METAAQSGWVGGWERREKRERKMEKKEHVGRGDEPGR